MAYEIVWRLSDKTALEREIELLFANAEERARAIACLTSKFSEDLQLHPTEWPASDKPPTEHAWQFGRISVHYRLIPSAQIAEVLSVTRAIQHQ